jgi:hypothetical protein
MATTARSTAPAVIVSAGVRTISVLPLSGWSAGWYTAEELLNSSQRNRAKVTTRLLWQACGIERSAELQGGHTVHQRPCRDWCHRDALGWSTAMSASASVELSGRTVLRALQVAIGTVNQLRPMHDGEVPWMVDREQHIRDTNGGEVAVWGGILECVCKEFVTFASQGCQDTLTAAEVVARRRVTDAKFDRQWAKAQLVNAIARNDVRCGCEYSRPKITMVIPAEHAGNLPVKSCHWQDPRQCFLLLD